MSISEKSIDEISETVQAGLKHNPKAFIIFTVIIVSAISFIINQYISYLSTTKQIEATSKVTILTMSEQNKVLSDGFKQQHDDALRTQDLLLQLKK